MSGPTHVCLDCGALGCAGGYHDHGDGNAGETIALTALPHMMGALHDVEMERDEFEAWNRRLVSVLREAVGVMRRQMLSDDATDTPFNEDMAAVLKGAEDVLAHG
jgi:hypothetical protein